MVQKEAEFQRLRRDEEARNENEAALRKRRNLDLKITLNLTLI